MNACRYDIETAFVLCECVCACLGGRHMYKDLKVKFSFFLFSRVLRDSISHFSVGPSVRPSVRNKVVLKAFYRVLNVSK